MTSKIAETWQDIRYSVRLAVQRPLFTFTVIGSLALGVGLDTAVFSFYDVLFLRPLPGVREPKGLVYLASGGARASRQLPLSYLNYRDLRERCRTFSDLAGYQSIRLGLATGNGEAEEVSGEVVTGNFFEVLGAEPALGRTFNSDASQIPGAQPEVVLGYGLWQRRFGSDPRILGRELLLNGRSFAVVGVAHRGFKGMNRFSAAELWVPLTMSAVVLPLPEMLENRGDLVLRVVGRLSSTMGLRSAASEMRAVAARLRQEYPADNEGFEIALTPLVKPPSFESGPMKAGAFLAVLMKLLLLIVTINVANMLLVQVVARRRELALRVALGASRGRLLRQSMIEGLVLSLAGGASGVLVGLWSLELLWRLRPPTLPERAVSLALDGKVLLFGLATALFAGLLVSMLPALQMSRTNLNGALSGDHGWGRVGGRRVSLVRGLVALQIALCTLCLACTGLFLQGLSHQLQIDPGFEPSHLLSASFDLKTQGYDEERGRELQRRLLERASALPGVRAAALSERRPLAGFRLWREVVAVLGGDPSQPGRKQDLVGSLIVSPGYFRTIGIPLERGRDFTAADRMDTTPVAIVNQAMAARLWPAGDALGARAVLDDEPEPVTIVGLVGNSKILNLDEMPMALVYLPLEQRYTPQAALNLRAASEPEPLLAVVRRAVGEIAPTLPVSDLLTGPQAIAQELWAPQAGAAVSGLLGLLALGLALFGVYGITADSIARRGREMGIRIALGAHPSGVLGLLVKSGMVTVLIGLALGSGLAFLSEKWISKLVSDLQDGTSLVLVLTLVAVLLLTVGALANALPALRALRKNPALDLRRVE